MKKISLILILVLLIPLLVVNVHAEDEEETGSVAWPQDFTHGDYSYTIESIKINVYKIDNTKTTTTTKTLEDGSTVTVSENEDLFNYIKKIPTRTIDLDGADYNLDPDYKEDKLGGYNTLFVSLGFDITKEKLEELLADEKAAVTNDISYIAEIVVNYKLTAFPEKYTYFNNINYLRTLYSSLYKQAYPTMTLYDPSVNITESLSQVINGVLIGKEEDETVLKYETKLSRDSGTSEFVLNYLSLSEEEMPTGLTTTEPDKTKYQLIMFHNVENIDYLIDNTKEVEKEAEETAIENTDYSVQEVAVPNTGKHSMTALYMSGIVLVLTGIMLIVYGKKMKQFRDIEYLGED